MKKNTIWIIVTLMAISLIGLSWFQLYWISNVIELSKQRFEKDALASLDNVTKRLERNEMAVVATNSFAFWGTSAEVTMANDTMHQVVDIELHEDTDSIDNSLWIRTNTSSSIKIVAESDSGEELHEFISDSIYNPTNVRFVVRIGHDSTLTNVNVDRINRKRKVFTRVVEEMMSHEVRESQRIHPIVIDSLLSQEFNSHGIHLSFEFGIYDSQEKAFKILNSTDKESLMASNLSASLFPNDIIGNTLSLIVSFPNKNQYLLGKIWISLLSSIFFILLITAIFAFVVYKVIHQKKLSDLKNDFINNMTHEFKTPLATVSLATEALQEDSVNTSRETMLRYVGVIQQESKRLATQVEKVLQLASMDKENLSLDRNIIKLNLIISAAVDRAKFQVEESKGSLTVEPGGDNVMVEADETHLANAVFNLLDNAIKYANGPPQITLSNAVDNNSVTISISDLGIGLSKDQQENIFKKFYRVPTGNLHDIKGFGLGLNYVKYIIEAHHGNISVISKLGKGSTFSIVLPIVK